MKKLFIAFMAATLVMIFTGCNKDNSNGRLIVKVTDAPFPINLIESATVTITKVEIRKAGLVTDKENAIISEVSVIVKQGDTEIASAITDASGIYAESDCLQELIQ